MKVKIGDIIYIQKYDFSDSEEEFRYYSSKVYDIKKENNKTYVYTKYVSNGLSFKMLENDIYTIDNKYYINMRNYESTEFGGN